MGTRHVLSLAAALFSGGAARADVEVILVADSGTDAIATLDPATGFEQNLAFINLRAAMGSVSMLPKDVIQVGDELWISDQSRDRIYRYSATTTPTYLGEITGAMDNIRGMAYDAARDAVWLANAGTENGAPGDAIIRIRASTGTIVGSFPVGPVPAGSPFDVEVLPDGTLAVTEVDSDTVQVYTDTGTLLGAWADNSGMGFPQQITRYGNNYVVAAFSATTGLYEFGPDGDFIQRFNSGGGPRGVAALDDGSLITSSGIWIIRYASGTGTVIISLNGSSFQYMARVTLSDGTSSCPADFSGDGFVDDTDFVTFAAAYEAFTIPPADPAADLSGDGFVDDTDFVDFAAAYEAFVCP